ncbi:mannose/fructose/N-acetylgalactosamine-specific phosphotransferase system component IIB [Clostridium acetobutylicum]|uniref:Predicted membrane protein CF_1 family n=2 Tax=Clostridium acetobutylicum TaxID=1488 RepID=Q97KJ6_CLOAB|nr:MULTISPECIES: membrane protein [Clostridium]AAK78899.1 Predicted membrane protein; CF_1 family [Clostridium acetobutylicum ATCC 824]ADZ19974.1 membrane protein; CF_1 family [Clostridium acetobutylicum EA 2018]AEI31504.1 hypothetical protein SMB_G0940 [Clostridium acetobutylicum DSM 1731]AWV80618.1 hypothetical protein DK921_11015 [Clostridium acetobutylicum]MBC2392808.1 hypothetical protein [Clostridium acetobutylicum]
MQSLKVDMRNGLLKINEAKQGLKSAVDKFSLKNKSRSIEIELKNLKRELKAVNQLEGEIRKINSNIDYMVKRFTDVDKKCASKLKTSGYTYRKKVGLLNFGEEVERVPVIGGIGVPIDAVESWVDRNKFVLKKTTTITLETGAIGVCIVTLPEAGITWKAWDALSAAGGVMSLDNIGTAASAIYQRKVERKSEEDSSGYDLFQSIFGGAGWYSAKILGVKNPSYWCSSGKTLYDRTSATVTVLNVGHSVTSLGKDVEKLPALKKAEASSANKTLEAANNAEKIHMDAMMATKNKINGINNAKKEVVDLKKLKKNVGKTNFEPYKNQFYKDKNLLKKDGNKLPQLQQDLLIQQDQLETFEKNTLNAKNKYNKSIRDLNKNYRDIKASLYNIPAGGTLYNTEDVQGSFHFNYFPGEIKPIFEEIKVVLGGER